jgi:hypothetical protein
MGKLSSENESAFKQNFSTSSAGARPPRRSLSLAAADEVIE